MSVFIALPLILTVAVLAFHLGRKQGRAEVAAHTIRELTPLLPLIEELLVHTSEFQKLSAEQTDSLARFHESARSN